MMPPGVGEEVPTGGLTLMRGVKEKQPGLALVAPALCLAAAQGGAELARACSLSGEARVLIAQATPRHERIRVVRKELVIRRMVLAGAADVTASSRDAVPHSPAPNECRPKL